MPKLLSRPPTCAKIAANTRVGQKRQDPRTRGKTHASCHVPPEVVRVAVDRHVGVFDKPLYFVKHYGCFLYCNCLNILSFSNASRPWIIHQQVRIFRFTASMLNHVPCCAMSVITDMGMNMTTNVGVTMTTNVGISINTNVCIHMASYVGISMTTNEGI